MRHCFDLRRRSRKTLYLLIAHDWYKSNWYLLYWRRVIFSEIICIFLLKQHKHLDLCSISQRLLHDTNFLYLHVYCASGIVPQPLFLHNVLWDTVPQLLFALATLSQLLLPVPVPQKNAPRVSTLEIVPQEMCQSTLNYLRAEWLDCTEL